MNWEETRKKLITFQSGKKLCLSKKKMRTLSHSKWSVSLVNCSSFICRFSVVARENLESFEAWTYWKADIVAGKTSGTCLVTLTDRKSCFLLAGKKVPRKKAAYVSEKMIELLSSIPNEAVKTITPVRGKEFSNHFAVTEVLNNMPFYFPDPHALGNNEQIKIRIDSFENTCQNRKR